MPTVEFPVARCEMGGSLSEVVAAYDSATDVVQWVEERGDAKMRRTLSVRGQAAVFARDAASARMDLSTLSILAARRGDRRHFTGAARVALNWEG